MSDQPRRTTLATRLLIVGGIVAMALVVLMMALVDRSIRRVWLDELDQRLAETATVVGAGRGGAEGDQIWVERVAEGTGGRVTLITADGDVIADSHSDEAAMENHADRPEIVTARSGELGTATRLSATSGFSQRYVAIPPVDGVIVRVSMPLSAIEEQLGRTRQTVAAAGVTVAILAIVLLFLFGRRLARPVVRLADQAHAVASGDLTVVPERSAISELDRLAMALGDIVHDLGGRIEEAEQASSTLEAVLAALPQGTLLFDKDDALVYANPAASEILGAVPNRLGSLAPLQLQELVRTSRTYGDRQAQEMEHGVPTRRLRAVATPLGPGGRALLVLSDITERAKLESMRRAFVTNASHELKTPVATAIAASEALKIALSRGDSSAERFASQVASASGQLERLVSDLLDLSRLEQELLDLVPMRLDDVVRAEAAKARERVEDNGISLGLATEEATVLGDEGALSAAVRNLIDNAVRHTPPGGRIDVEVGVADGEAVLRVADTGEGIPTADLDRVFERFYRVDSARSRETGGTGLGLAIVRHVVENHGGRVSVHSSLGAGSTFTVELPLGFVPQPEAGGTGPHEVA